MYLTDKKRRDLNPAVTRSFSPFARGSFVVGTAFVTGFVLFRLVVLALGACGSCAAEGGATEQPELELRRQRFRSRRSARFGRDRGSWWASCPATAAASGRPSNCLDRRREADLERMIWAPLR